MELAIFGFGYSAEHLAAQARLTGAALWGTKRRAQQQPFECLAYEAGADSAALAAKGTHTTHVLISIPPIDACGGVVSALLPALSAMKQLRWVGYLSTTGVYGDHGGAWVDESTALAAAATPRAAARIAEEQMLREHCPQAHIFRVSGIYGPGRSVIDQLMSGHARRIHKAGQVFSRIHVADIARCLMASMQAPTAGEIYNLADDYPCAAEEVMAHGASLLGISPPPLEDYAQVQSSLSPMMREFYSASRRVANKKIKEKLGVQLAFPSYREGLAQILQYTHESSF